MYDLLHAPARTLPVRRTRPSGLGRRTTRAAARRPVPDDVLARRRRWLVEAHPIFAFDRHHVVAGTVPVDQTVADLTNVRMDRIIAV